MFWRTHVLTPPGGLVTELPEQRQKTSLAGGPHPFDPLGRAVQLLRARQRLRPTPGPVERADPVGSHHLIGESLAAIIQEEAFEFLDAPVRIIGALDTPVPYSPPLENYFLPSEEEIERAARRLLAY